MCVWPRGSVGEEEVFVPAKVQARARDIASAVRPVVVGADARAAEAFDAAVAGFQDAGARRARFVAAQFKPSNSLSPSSGAGPVPAEK